MGVQRTTDFLEKGTWGLVIALMVFCLAINILGPSGTPGAGSRLNDQLETPVQSNPGLNLPGNTNAAPAAPAEAAAPVAGDSSAN